MSELDVLTSNRPDDTAFRQQRLKAWQPILTPRWVIGAFTLIGLIFIPIGATLKVQSDGVFEQSVQYDGKDTTAAMASCRITTANEGYESIVNGTRKTCTISFNVTKDLPAGKGISVFYELTNFYQNHRRYVKSRNDRQVGGDFVPNTTLAQSCDPEASYMVDNQIYWPCGLIATSYFNDGLQLASPGLSLNEKGIAWGVDMDVKFQNPTGPDASNNWAMFRYLWQTYDQMSCYDNVDPTQRVTCIKWGDLVPGAYGRGCAKCPAGSTPVNEGGIPPPMGWQAFDPITPATNGNTPYGVRDEHFLVWMRTAGLPTFRKLYGTIPAPAGGFKAGSQIVFNIVPNFEVESFGGKKSLVLSTATPIGGKSDALGIAYIVVGGMAWFFALAFLAKHLISPRKLGDTRYIVWRQGGNAKIA